MPKRRSRGLGNNPLDDLTEAPAAQEDTSVVPETTNARTESAHAQPPLSSKKTTGGARRWKRVMVYLDPKTDGQWLNEAVGRARAEGLTQRQMGETEILRAGLAELQQLSWEELVKRVTQRPHSKAKTNIAE
jgi:hypothetical protein